MKVSVIMSFYNETENELKIAINSILNQTYKNIEFIIICDNPENLCGIKLVKSLQDKRIIFIENKNNIGLVKSLNLGIGRATGDFIARMDADDESMSDRFRKQVEILSTNKEIFLVSTDAELVDENGNLIKRKFNLSQKKIVRALKWGNILYHPTFMMRKEILLKLKGYREVLFAEDYDLVLRALELKEKVYFINEKLIKYKIRKNGISRSKEVEQRKTAMYLKELNRKAELNKFTVEKNKEKIKNNFKVSDLLKERFDNLILKLILFMV